MKTIACREAGFNRATVVRGETEVEVLGEGRERAMQDHKMTAKQILQNSTRKSKGLFEVLVFHTSDKAEHDCYQ
jgi:hypothetical protein